MLPSASDYDRARSAFDYFSSFEDGATAFMENAGGSQVPRCVVNAISEYFARHYAQLGAGYGRSQRATQTVRDAHAWLEVLMNAKGQGQVVVGPSTSQLAFNLASAFASTLGPGDSIVLQITRCPMLPSPPLRNTSFLAAPGGAPTQQRVPGIYLEQRGMPPWPLPRSCSPPAAPSLGRPASATTQEASHESVLGPWVRLARQTGCKVRWWSADRSSGCSPLSGLEAAVDASTRLVVVTHVSNLLGDILDLAAVVRLVRSRAPAAQLVADGVAYAPHRAMDVSGWGVDWYLWSAYKVYGPHVAVMYGRREAFEALLGRGGQGPNHYFVPAGELPYAFELGGASHEGCAGLLALQDYLIHLLGQHQHHRRHHQDHQDGGQPHQRQQQQQQDETECSVTPHAPTSLAGTAEESDKAAASAGDASVPGGSGQPTSPGSSSPPPPLRGVHATRQQVEAAFALMTAMEQQPQEQLLSYLSSHLAVRLVGSADPDPALRVPTVSFVHRIKSSQLVAQELQAAGFAVRCGHMYARRLVEALAVEGGLLAAEAAARQGGGGGDPARFDEQQAVEEGVVRVSLVHYNTPEEVGRLIEAMNRVL